MTSKLPRATDHRNRQVYSVEDLPDEWVRAIATTEPGADSKALDRELAPRRRLWDASDRFFAHPFDLTPALNTAPEYTLSMLRTDPAAITAVRPSLDGQRLAKAHARLMAAAEAYVASLPTVAATQ
jgi:hypothetical protein